MKQFIKYLIVLIMIFVPVYQVQAADTNGPLTFTSFNTDPLIYRGSVITINGLGFNSILKDNDIWLIPEATPVPDTIYPEVLTHTDTVLSFKVPQHSPFGMYSIQITAGSTGYSVMNNGLNWTFRVRDHEPAPDNASPTGTNVLGPDGTVYRIDASRTRSPYTSAGAFTSYKFNTWAGVRKATAADMALPLTTYYPVHSTVSRNYYIPPRDGSLINDRGTVWLIFSGVRTGFESDTAFTNMGYSYTNVYPGDTSFMYTAGTRNGSPNYIHDNGTLVKNNGTLYIVHDGQRIGIPSMQVLDSWGYWPTDAVQASASDLSIPPSSRILSTRVPEYMNIPLGNAW